MDFFEYEKRLKPQARGLRNQMQNPPQSPFTKGGSNNSPLLGEALYKRGKQQLPDLGRRAFMKGGGNPRGDPLKFGAVAVWVGGSMREK